MEGASCGQGKPAVHPGLLGTPAWMTALGPGPAGPRWARSLCLRIISC